MLEIDETELIDFFGVLPTEQDPEEKELFGTTIFDIHQDGLHLSVSFSAYCDDFSLDLKTEEAENPFLELRLYGVREVKVKRDKPIVNPVLWILVQENDEAGESSVQVVCLEVEPKIRIRVRNGSEAAEHPLKPTTR
jgi:hypothetical protein